MRNFFLNYRLLISLLSIMTCFLSLNAGALKIASIFTDNMVLQRGKYIRIFGNATSGDIVYVSLGTNKSTANVDANGRWIAYLNPEEANDNPRNLIIECDNEKIILNNILIGDVWLAGGQSNMQMKIANIDSLEKKKIISTNDDLLRYYQVANVVSGGKINKSSDISWTSLNNGNCIDWSAVAVNFALEMRKQLKVPIGIICVAQGSSNIESWIGRNYSKIDNIKNYFQKDLEDVNIQSNYKNAHRLYDSMLSKVSGYTIKGVIWYQGEANAKSGIAKDYGYLLSSLIENWRETWSDERMIFGVVQLPNYNYKESLSTTEHSWAVLRQQQKAVCDSMRYTVMAVSADLGENNNIHPKKKNEVSKRLCYEILNAFYDKKELPVSPRWGNPELKNGNIVIPILSTSCVADNSLVNGFEVSTTGFNYKPVKAQISNGDIIVYINGNDCKYIRYAWTNNPVLSIYDKNKMPISPVLFKIK